MTHSVLTGNARLDPWWWEAAPPVAGQPTSLPQEVDVAIVGAGYTGATAALTCAKAGRSVVLIDAEDPGFGASTRNGGMIGSGHRVGYDELSRQYGDAVAEEVLHEGARALDFTTGLIKSEEIVCDFKRVGRFRGAWLRADYEAMGREVDFLRKKIGIQAHMVTRSEQHQEVAVDAYQGGCIYTSHGGLHPAKFFQGLLDGAVAAGARVAARTTVVSIKRAGNAYVIQTTRGTFRAGDVIIATNGYTTHATPSLRRRVIPIASYMIATEPLGRERVKAMIPSGRMIVETRSQHCYYRPSTDGDRIMLGARASLNHIDPAKSAGSLRRLLVGLFPDLNGMRVSHSWLGTLGFSKDHLPHIGKTPDGLHYALGYSGSGVAMAPYLGWRVANKVLGTEDGDTGFDKIRHPGVLLRDFVPLGLPAVNAWYRIKDVMEGS